MLRCARDVDIGEVVEFVLEGGAGRPDDGKCGDKQRASPLDVTDTIGGDCTCAFPAGDGELDRVNANASL